LSAITPHTDNFSDPFATIAMYSFGVVHESLSLIKDNDVDRVLNDISTMVINAIDVYIQERDNMDYSLPNFEQIIQDDMLMRKETSIQKE
jgi:hypothetical protein